MSNILGRGFFTLSELQERHDELAEFTEADADDVLSLSDDELEELEELKTAIAACEKANIDDYETLISEYEIDEHIQDFATDIHGKAIRDAVWPFNYIDWPAAVDAAKQDYSIVEINGTDYYYRE